MWTKNWHHEDKSFCYMDVDNGPVQNDQQKEVIHALVWVSPGGSN